MAHESMAVLLETVYVKMEVGTYDKSISASKRSIDHSAHKV